MRTTKLNQVLAIEKGVKNKAQGFITKLYHKMQKGVLLNGLNKSYEPLNEDGIRYPSERQRVQVRADEALKGVQKTLIELFDITAQKDWANCSAKADVVVGGNAIIKNVPVTYLLFLEKQLVSLQTLLSKTPTLDAAEDWTYDDAAGVFKSQPVRTTRSTKIQKPIVLYPATTQHPAQTQMVSEDQIVGHWTTIKQSGALPTDRKSVLLERIERLLEAVKFARETANSQDAERILVGEKVFNYIFANA